MTTTWFAPAPGTRAHHVRTGVRAAGVLALAGYLGLLSTLIPS